MSQLAIDPNSAVYTTDEVCCAVCGSIVADLFQSMDDRLSFFVNKQRRPGRTA